MKKIQTLAEYQQLASRTCPDLGSNLENAFHMNSGIITEIGEGIDPIKKHFAYKKPLDLVNVGEEIADCAWYISNKARMFLSPKAIEGTWGDEKAFEEGILDFEKVFASDLEKASTETLRIKLAANFLYTISYTVVDMESYDEMSSLGLPNMILLKKASDLLGLDFYQILTNNIEKLQIRYPEKFTEEAALNRDLDAEREVLEKESPEKE